MRAAPDAINRTIVELKYRNVFSEQEADATINRTIVELKLRSAWRRSSGDSLLIALL